MSLTRHRTFLNLFLLCISLATAYTATSIAGPNSEAHGPHRAYSDSYNWNTGSSTYGWTNYWEAMPYLFSTEYPPDAPDLYGLAIRPQGGHVYSSGKGVWSFRSPGETTISSASFQNVWHNNNPDKKQCLRVALYTGSSTWQAGYDRCDSGSALMGGTFNLDDPADVAKFAQLWLFTGPCAPDDCHFIPEESNVYSLLGAIGLTLIDHETPTASLTGYLKDHAGDWLKNEGAHNTTASAHDPGSGVSYVALDADYEIIAEKTSNCDPYHDTYPSGEICPYDDSVAGSINLANYAEGPLLVESETYDYADSAYQSPGIGSSIVYIDTAPPEIELSNVLPQLKDLWVTSAANHEITIGGYDTGSGIIKIELLTNDPIHGTQLVETYDSTCNFGAPNGEYCPAEDEATWELDLTDYPQGEMSVIARVEDLTGRVTEESFNIKVDTQPPPEPEGEEVEGEDGGATLTWDPVELEPDDDGSPLKGYRVRYSITDGQSWEPWQETTNTEKHVTGVPVGTEVQFEAQSEDEAGWYSDATTASADAYKEKGKKTPKKAGARAARAKTSSKSRRPCKNTNVYKARIPCDFDPYSFQRIDKSKGIVDDVSSFVKGLTGLKFSDVDHECLQAGGEGENTVDPINIVVFNDTGWGTTKDLITNNDDANPHKIGGGGTFFDAQCTRVPNVNIDTDKHLSDRWKTDSNRIHARLFQSNGSSKKYTALTAHRDKGEHPVQIKSTKVDIPGPINIPIYYVAVRNPGHKGGYWMEARDRVLRPFTDGVKCKEWMYEREASNLTGINTAREFGAIPDHDWNNGRIKFVDGKQCQARRERQKVQVAKRHFDKYLGKKLKNYLSDNKLNHFLTKKAKKYKKTIKNEIVKRIDKLMGSYVKSYKKNIEKKVKDNHLVSKHQKQIRSALSTINKKINSMRPPTLKRVKKEVNRIVKKEIKRIKLKRK